MSDNGHVIFAECFQETPDDELMTEYERVLILPSSEWRSAVLHEIAERRLPPPPVYQKRVAMR